MLSSTGDHEPVIPLFEVAGNGVNVVPEHIGAIALKVGVTLVFTLIVSVAVVAH